MHAVRILRLQGEAQSLQRASHFLHWQLKPGEALDFAPWEIDLDVRRRRGAFDDQFGRLPAANLHHQMGG